MWGDTYITCAVLEYLKSVPRRGAWRVAWCAEEQRQGLQRGLGRGGVCSGAWCVVCGAWRGATRSRLSRVWACQLRAGPVIFSQDTSIPGGDLPVSVSICQYLSVKRGQGSQAGRRGAVEKKGRGLMAAHLEISE